jgi:cytochrome oxidase Cu insertion factor (SCO1/SenC/PrrC family)
MFCRPACWRVFRDTRCVRVSANPSSVAGGSGRSFRRLRWLFLGAVVLLGVLGGSLIALLQVSHRSTAVPAGIVAGPTPPVSWPAGKRRAPAFQLVDQSGRRVSLAAYRGRPVIVTFIDPLCRNFCPLEAKQLNELVRSLPSRSRPAIVAVSVNVYGNARANLLQDVAKWRLVPQWRWAVGGDRQLARVWREYQVGVLVRTKKIARVTVHEIAHTEAAYVVDERGFERALFLWPFRAEDVLALLRRLGVPSAS